MAYQGRKGLFAIVCMVAAFALSIGPVRASEGRESEGRDRPSRDQQHEKDATPGGKDNSGAKGSDAKGNATDKGLTKEQKENLKEYMKDVDKEAKERHERYHAQNDARGNASDARGDRSAQSPIFEGYSLHMLEKFGFVDPHVDVNGKPYGADVPSLGVSMEFDRYAEKFIHDVEHRDYDDPEVSFASLLKESAIRRTKAGLKATGLNTVTGIIGAVSIKDALVMLQEGKTVGEIVAALGKGAAYGAFAAFATGAIVDGVTEILSLSHMSKEEQRNVMKPYEIMKNIEENLLHSRSPFLDPSEPAWRALQREIDRQRNRIKDLERKRELIRQNNMTFELPSTSDSLTPSADRPDADHLPPGIVKKSL